MKFLRKIILGLILICLTQPLSVWAQGALLKGEGSSLIYPLFSKWMIDFSGGNPGFEIDYKPTGSSAGIRQLLAGDIDFLFTESFMTDEEVAKSGGTIKHLPVSVAGIGLVANLPGNTMSIKLTAQVLVDIYLGNILTWDNEKIIQLNPKLKVPTKFPIVVVYRSDGSGTNEVFSDYLSKSSAAWSTQVGKSRIPKWPIGLGAGGSQGVIGIIRQNPGAIGYVGSSYLKINNLLEIAIQNSTGEFVLPRPDSIEAAAKLVASEIPKNFKQSLTAIKGQGAYPISAYTYIAMRTKGDAKKIKLNSKWIKWLLGSGQKLNNSLDHAPLPNSVLKKAKLAIVENLP